MRFKRFIWFGGIFVCLLVLNYVGRKKLPYAYAEILSYNQLYYQDETIRITRVYCSSKDSLTFEFRGGDIKGTNLFELFLDSALFAKKTSKYLTIMPSTGLNRYMLRINGGRNYSIDIDRSSLDINYNNNQTVSSSYEVSSRDILISDIRLTRFNDWKETTFWKEETLDTSEVNRYLRDSIKILSTDKTSIKAAKIARYIIQSTFDRSGAPSEQIKELNPIQQLEEFRSGRSKLWCGNYSYLFAFFSTKAGIPVRTITCGTDLSGVSTGTHVFNEVFLNEEQSWAYVDLTMRNVFVKKNGQFLNAAQVYSLFKLKGDDADGIVALHVSKDTMQEQAFNNVSGLTKYYFHPGNEFHYLYSDYFKKSFPGNIGERFINFFCRKPYYAVYSDNISFENYQFYYRLISNYCLAMFILVCIICAFIKKPLSKNKLLRGIN